MVFRAPLLALVCVALGGCGGTPGERSPNATSPSRTTTCAALTAHLVTFGEALETSFADAKTRGGSDAGRLELLLSFEDASLTLDGELGGLHSTRDLDAPVKRARSALEKSAQFAHGEREIVEKNAKELTPLAKETQQAWLALKTTCEGKRAAPDCAGVRDAIGRFDSAGSPAEHDRAVRDLAALRIASPVVLRARDRAVTASKTVKDALRSRTVAAESLPKRWATVHKELSGAMDGLVEACKGQSPLGASLVSAHRPDPRKLTVLVHVRPSAGVEKALLSLAASSTDEDEKEFYKARAEGAFGSGFLLVKQKAQGGTELLVVTNRHVVDLGDRASLELADGTSLGVAEVVYSNPVHDLAVLRPTTSLPVKEGFAFAGAPAKDQQTVIATGFPGLVGRPSYQTTKGYVSNESFKLDDGTRPLTYLQHTAPIDPGSSGGPLTDESGRVLGVNTLKVSGRDSVGLAVPSRFVVDTLREAAMIESRHGSARDRLKSSRLACLAFMAELGADEPRLLVIEQMIANHLVSTNGLDAATLLASEDGFEQLWNTDSVRAMRIATLVQLRMAFMMSGGPSVLETCDDLDPASAAPEHVRYNVRLGNFETRALALRWEHGRWRVDGFDTPRPTGTKTTQKKLPPPGPPTNGRRSGKKVAPPRAK
jgi:serine protease Do